MSRSNRNIPDTPASPTPSLSSTSSSSGPQPGPSGTTGQGQMHSLGFYLRAAHADQVRQQYAESQRRANEQAARQQREREAREEQARERARQEAALQRDLQRRNGSTSTFTSRSSHSTGGRSDTSLKASKTQSLYSFLAEASQDGGRGLNTSQFSRASSHSAQERRGHNSTIDLVSSSGSGHSTIDLVSSSGSSSGHRGAPTQGSLTSRRVTE